MLFNAATVLALASVAAAGKNGRTFAVNHFYGNGPLVTGRMDPIVSPGVASSHEHAVHGGSNFALSLTDTALMDSRCTSAVVKNDKSAYWTPSLYFQDPTTKKYEAVKFYYMNVYYFFEKTDDEVKAFPPGLRIFVGNPNARTPPAFGGGSNLVQNGQPIQPVQWTCPRSNYNSPSYPANSDGLHGYGMADPNNKGQGAGFPDQNCDGLYSPLRADIHLPSCYDPSKGLTDYKNNMAWPTDAGNGKQNCPKGFIHVPHMFYEVYWDTQKFAGRWTPGQGKQPFVLSNGDSTGYSLHADFVAGWDQATLQNFIDTCDAGDAGFEKCPSIIGGLNDRSTSCNIPNAVQEAAMVAGSSQLPGGLTTTGFGAVVGSGATSPAPVVVAPAAPAPAASSSTTAAAAPPAATTPANTGSNTGSGTGSEGGPGKVIATVTVHVTSTTTRYPSSTPSGLANKANLATGSSPVTAGWTSKGCWSDSLSARVLSGKTFVAIGNHQVTTTACIAYCDKAGFSMAGTEYGAECFCANVIKGSTPLADAKCDMKCEGDRTQTCGGRLALNVFAKGGSVARREEDIFNVLPRASRVHRHMLAHKAGSI